MDIYENIIIGNFLFDLGVKMGRAQLPILPVSVNLLQQTPLDKAFGDVFLSDFNTFRLIEFKRAADERTKEADKLRKLQDRLASQPRLEALSRKIHWYVCSDFRRPSATPIRVIPYLDLSTRSLPLTVDMSSFEDAIVRQFLHPSPNEPEPHQCRQYLELVQQCTSGSTAASGALIITINEKGQLKHIAIDDIRDFLYPSPFRQRLTEMERDRGRGGLERDRGREGFER